VVVIVPDTAPSGATIIEPTPEAEVITGGTSWAPESVTFIDCAETAKESIPKPKPISTLLKIRGVFIHISYVV
jgi:hypothetical protein